MSVRVKVSQVSLEDLADAGWELGDNGAGERSLSETQDRDHTLGRLTGRQREVAALLADGYTRRETAERLSVCLQAVHQIVLRMRKRLNQISQDRLP